MTTLIEVLNRWGGHAIDFASGMLWQSSVLIAGLLVLDILLRRRARAVFRYALWSLVILKLVLPPSLALPTGLGYWPRANHATPLPAPLPRPFSVITFPDPTPWLPSAVPAARVRPRLAPDGRLLIAWFAGSTILLGFLIRRSRQVARLVRQADSANPELQSLLDQARRQLGLCRPIRLKLSPSAFSPAVCGLWRPAMLLPRDLALRLPPDQLRAVLFHELVHLQRHDVWINCLQALLQVVYWWHPLVWLANARIRRVREEAVDEAVMVALGSQADTYPGTLLAVAKLAFARPLTALGLVGIFESKGALQQRIRRLLDRPVPRTAKLNATGILAVAACGALLLPMARGQRASTPKPSTQSTGLQEAANVLVECRFLEISGTALQALALGPPDRVGTNGHQVWVFRPLEMTNRLTQVANQPGIRLICAPRMTLRSGMAGLISDTHSEQLDGRDVNVKSTCEVTPQVNGTNLDLILQATIKQTAAMNADRGPARTVDAFGVLRELADVHLTLPDGGGVFVLNPNLPATEGRHSVLVAKVTVYTNPGDVLAGAGVLPPTAVELTTKAEAGLAPTRPQQQAATLVQDGKLLYEMGQLDEAEAKLRSAIAKEPSNGAGLYYLKLIAEARKYNRTREREAIKSKLHRITLDEVLFEGLPLPMVVQYLSEQTLKQDPEKQGVPFLINSNIVVAAAPAPLVDPNTGLVIPSPSPEPPVMDHVLVKISPAMHRARLNDVLDAVVKAADKPITYTIEPDGVVFSPKTPDQVRLETRIYKLDPKTFLEGLRAVGAPPLDSRAQEGAELWRWEGEPPMWTPTNGTYAVQQDPLRAFFAAPGVNVGPPNQFYFSVGRGVLMVRATPQELDIIEKTIQALNVAPPPKS